VVVVDIEEYQQLWLKHVEEKHPDPENDRPCFMCWILVFGAIFVADDQLTRAGEQE
jgi:hypothetical protein